MVVVIVIYYMSSQPTEVIQRIIEDVLKAMDVQATVEPEDSITKGLVFNIQSRDSYMLIGRQGLHLQALQTICYAIAGKHFRGVGFPVFMIDVDDYKRKREWFLRETAKQAAEQCKRTGMQVSLEPMPNFERKLVHAYLQEHFPDVSSDSVGEEPRRKIVIRIARES